VGRASVAAGRDQLDSPVVSNYFLLSVISLGQILHFFHVVLSPNRNNF
jgi:hypothetical protein